MKTVSIHRIIAGITFSAILFLCSPGIRSQQLITFTNGATLKVHIVYQTKDSVQYYKYDNPDVLFSESMDRVVRIVSAEYPGNLRAEQKVTTLLEENEYLKYKKGTRTGGVLLGTGGVLVIAGVIGWTSTVNSNKTGENEFLGRMFSVMGMTLGSGLFITGGILAIVNGTNMATYKKGHGLSINLKAGPQMTGLSLAYRF